MRVVLYSSLILQPHPRQCAVNVKLDRLNSSDISSCSNLILLKELLTTFFFLKKGILQWFDLAHRNRCASESHDLLAVCMRGLFYFSWCVHLHREKLRVPLVYIPLRETNVFCFAQLAICWCFSSLHSSLNQPKEIKGQCQLLDINTYKI